MRLRVCSLILLFMALSIEAKDKQADQCDPNVPESVKMSGYFIMKKKIFIYNPHLGYHHVHFMTTIANALDKAGHEVTMLDSLIYNDIKPLPYRRKTIRNFTVRQNSVTKKIADDGEKKDDGLMSVWTDLSIEKKVRATFSFYRSVTGFSEMVSSQCEDVLHSDEFKEIHGSRTYDLAITEAFDFCGVGLMSVMDVKKTILASSVPLHEYIGEKLGLPKTFDIVPTKFSMSTAYEHRKDFNEYERSGIIKNIMESSLIGENMFGYLEMKEAVIFQRKYPNFPGFEKLLRKSHSLMENVHTLMDLSKPTLNAIIPIGGITQYATEKEQSSPEKIVKVEEIKKIISNAKEKEMKVVLVSFGTVTKTATMKKEIIENLLEALRDVEKTEFIWKAEREHLRKRKIKIPSNVHVREWLPQNELLANGSIDLFVSHMGIGSMTEAAYHGVPMIAIPIFVDQHYNYVCAKRLQIANFVDKYTLGSTSGELRVAIQNTLSNKTMKDHSIQLAANLKKFGNQTTRMLDHINFILSLPDDSESIAFLNHHHGLNLMLGIRSLLHLVPYYAVPVTIVAIVIASILFVFLPRWFWNRLLDLINLVRRVPTVANGQMSFGQVTLISVGFYCMLFISLALVSFLFCPIANKMSEIAERSPAYNTEYNFVFYALILVLVILAFFSDVLYLKCPRFHAISQFTTYILLSFFVIIVVLWCCNLVALYTYAEVRK